jgi:hypothetical protein
VKWHAAASIYANAFLIGAVLMGFEMLGSRYLYPYFGGGIGTWAGLISMVLCALTIGYFAGGEIVDRYPSSQVVAAGIGVAAVYLALVPLNADRVMTSIVNGIGDGVWGILIADAALLLVPMSLLGTYSPFAVRLLIRTTEDAGRVAGFVYSISTVGSVFGTLFTTFALIPAIGSRSITYIYAVVLAAAAACLFVTAKKAR